MFIKECECGSNHFIINEGISHSAELDCDGDLTVYGNQANEIESIFVVIVKEYIPKKISIRLISNSMKKIKKRILEDFDKKYPSDISTPRYNRRLKEWEDIIISDEIKEYISLIVDTASVKDFKYKAGDEIINKWNWHYIIVGRYRNERGTNCYKVKNNEDLMSNFEYSDDPIWKEGWVGVQKEWEIRRLDN